MRIPGYRHPVYMKGDREQGVVARLLLALIAAAVLGTGLLLVVNRSVVDQAAVTAAPGNGTGALEPAGGDTAPGGDTGPAGDTAPTGGTASDGPARGVTGDTATTRPGPSSGLSAPGTSGAAGEPAGAGPGSAAGTPTGSGTAVPGTAADDAAVSGGGAVPPAATTDPAGPASATSGTADTTSAPGLPYGTAATERTAAQAPGELARTGPAVPSSVAVLLVAAGLVLAAVTRAAAPGDD